MSIKPKWRHYVYLHYKKNTDIVFYVGKGTLRKNRNDNYGRAFVQHKNPYWQNIVRKYDYDVLIFAACITDEEAKRLEKELIRKYGRDNLCNMTDGGDGSCGINVTKRTREKLSKLAKLPRSEKWIASIRKARKNGGNGGVVVKGQKLSQQWRDNISNSVKGKNNSMFGRTGFDHPNSKPVINIDNGIVYGSVQEAADIYSINPKTLYQYLDGTKRNKTLLRRVS